MAFSEAQLNEVIQRINKGLSTDVPAKLNELKFYNPTPPVPPFIEAAIKWLVTEMTKLALDLTNKIKEALEGAAAPITFFNRALDWQDARGLATQVSGQFKLGVLTGVGNTWKGSAATNYGKIIVPNGLAADKLGVVAKEVATALTLSAVAGLAFYVALGVLVGTLIALLVAAIAAIASGAFSWAGALAAIGGTKALVAALVTATTALAAALATQGTALSNLRGELRDLSAFPGGSWPKPGVEDYNDATVKDGDADWSLKG